MFLSDLPSLYLFGKLLKAQPCLLVHPFVGLINVLLTSLQPSSLPLIISVNNNNKVSVWENFPYRPHLRLIVMSVFYYLLGKTKWRRDKFNERTIIHQQTTTIHSFWASIDEQSEIILFRHFGDEWWITFIKILQFILMGCFAWWLFQIWLDEYNGRHSLVKRTHQSWTNGSYMCRYFAQIKRTTLHQV